MKAKITSTALLWACLSFGQTTETITIPKGIVYNYCDVSLLERAKQLINEAIKTNEYPLSQNKLIIGPTLWQRFDKIKSLHTIEGDNTTFLVEDKERKGKMTKELNDSKKVWAEVRKEVKGNTYIIRKLTPDELRYFWSMISFNIEEPIFILEADSHSYLLNLSNKDLKLTWLDEVPQH